MQHDQQFCLRWHHHQASVVGALGGALESGALADVTLSAGGASVRAHRLVLASCSSYFAALFNEVTSSSVVVVLGCSAAELRLLLSFMYTGEVTCSRRRLPRLLRLARKLRVDGLTDHADAPAPSSDTEEDKESDEASAVSPVTPHTSAGEGPTLDRTPSSSPGALELQARGRPLSKLDLIVQQLYSSHEDGGGAAAAPAAESRAVVAGKSAGTDGVGARVSGRRWRLDSGPGGGAVCGVCHKRLSNQYNLRVHLETHAGKRHACHACSHVSRSRDALRKHVAYRHPPTHDTHAHTRATPHYRHVNSSS